MFYRYCIRIQKAISQPKFLRRLQYNDTEKNIS